VGVGRDVRVEGGGEVGREMWVKGRGRCGRRCVDMGEIWMKGRCRWGGGWRGGVGGKV